MGLRPLPRSSHRFWHVFFYFDRIFIDLPSVALPTSGASSAPLSRSSRPLPSLKLSTASSVGSTLLSSPLSSKVWSLGASTSSLRLTSVLPSCRLVVPRQHLPHRPTALGIPSHGHQVSPSEHSPSLAGPSLSLPATSSTPSSSSAGRCPPGCSSWDTISSWSCTPLASLVHPRQSSPSVGEIIVLLNALKDIAKSGVCPSSRRICRRSTPSPFPMSGTLFSTTTTLSVVFYSSTSPVRLPSPLLAI